MNSTRLPLNHGVSFNDSHLSHFLSLNALNLSIYKLGVDIAVLRSLIYVLSASSLLSILSIFLKSDSHLESKLALPFANHAILTHVVSLMILLAAHPMLNTGKNGTWSSVFHSDFVMFVMKSIFSAIALSMISQINNAKTNHKIIKFASIHLLSSPIFSNMSHSVCTENVACSNHVLVIVKPYSGITLGSDHDSIPCQSAVTAISISPINAIIIVG